MKGCRRRWPAAGCWPRAAATSTECSAAPPQHRKRAATVRIRLHRCRPCWSRPAQAKKQPRALSPDSSPVVPVAVPRPTRRCSKRRNPSRSSPATRWMHRARPRWSKVCATRPASSPSTPTPTCATTGSRCAASRRRRATSTTCACHSARAATRSRALSRGAWSASKSSRGRRRFCTDRRRQAGWSTWSASDRRPRPCARSSCRPTAITASRRHSTSVAHWTRRACGATGWSHCTVRPTRRSTRFPNARRTSRPR